MKRKNTISMDLPEALQDEDGKKIRDMAEMYPEEDREWDRKIDRMLFRRNGNSRIDHLTMNEFKEICKWKSSGSRNIGHYDDNEEIEIESKSRDAFADNNLSSCGRLKKLADLKGAGIKTASAIMHFAFPTEYPVIDYRVLATLGVKTKPGSSVSCDLWDAY